MKYKKQDLKASRLVDCPVPGPSQSKSFAQLILHLVFVDGHIMLQKMNVGIAKKQNHQ